MKIKVTAKVSGYGASYIQTVYVSQEEIEALARKKIEEFDASPVIHATSVEFIKDSTPEELRTIAAQKV